MGNDRHTTIIGSGHRVEKGLSIAGDICIYTNHNQTIEQLDY